MTTTLNATTSNGLVVTPDNSGNIVLQYNGVAAPAFSVYLSTNQSISATTWTKINFNTKLFDTANCYDSSTNYRFTPTVAGYYQFNTAAAVNGSVTGMYVGYYKNGSLNSRIFGNPSNSGVGWFSNLIYCNGTTDYVEVYLYMYGTPTTVNGNATDTFFTGCLLRGA